MITIENNGSNILLFGRDKEGKEYINVDSTFKPYFYYDDWKGKYKSIDGKNVSIKYCNHPGDVVTEREKYEITYESDVVYTNRYIIDNINKLEQEPIRLCYIDIEIKRTKDGYESPQIASNPILMIGCFDNFDKEKTRFVLKDYKNEKDMLKAFINHITIKNPDILIAWNGDMFDFPFLINRINNIGLNADNLGRNNGRSYVKEFGAKIYGRILIDILQVYKKHFSGGGRESWSLDYISKYELKNDGGKEKYKGELDDLYENDIEKFIKYNDRDVELMILLNEKLRMIEFMDEVRRICYCKFEDLFMNSKLADCLCLKYAKGKFILPKCPPKIEKEHIIGAFVRHSEPKLHENIAVMDMKSLYPSVMIGFNISYETISLTPKDGFINFNNQYYFRKEKGIIPAILKPILDHRKEVAKRADEMLKTYGPEDIEYKSLWMLSYALKVIANSFYGSLLLETFRLYKRDAGQSITHISQHVTKNVHKWFEDHGLKVIYGDTDSVFLMMDGRTIEDMINLNKEINESFKQYFKQFGVEDENNIFKLMFEKVFTTLFFKMNADGEGVKKKYAGRMTWYDGKEVDLISITGFESKRSDNPEAGREFLKNILEMILRKKSKEEIDLFVNEFKIKVKSAGYTPEQIAFPIGISKKLEEYGNQIHAKASRIANEKHKAGIKQGDKIKYIFVKSPEKVIAFKNYLYDGYVVDYDKVIRRIVDLKIGPLYTCLGWNYIYPNKVKEGKKLKELSFEDKLKQVGLWS